MNNQPINLAAIMIAVMFAASPMIAAPEKTDKKSEKEEGFVALFDGKSLDGWVKADGKTPDKGWVVEDGTIHRKARGGDIYSEKEFGDFELRFEWKVAEGANSGVKYKIKQFGRSYLGPEYQVLDDEKHSNGKNKMTSAGAMYALFPADDEAKKLKPVGEWNAAKIVVKGTKFEHWLNGKKIVEADTSSEEWAEAISKSKFKNVEGYAKNEKGKLMLQDHGDLVWFRNIRIKEFEKDEEKSESDAAAKAD